MISFEKIKSYLIEELFITKEKAALSAGLIQMAFKYFNKDVDIEYSEYIKKMSFCESTKRLVQLITDISKIELIKIDFYEDDTTEEFFFSYFTGKKAFYCKPFYLPTDLDNRVGLFTWNAFDSQYSKTLLDLNISIFDLESHQKLTINFTSSKDKQIYPSMKVEKYGL